MNSNIFRYIDGNGNEYILTEESKIIIEYIPVKPLFSSSGIYDGGDYVKKEITKSQFRKIFSILYEAIENKEIQIKNRVKMSGMIIIQGKSKEDVYILKPISKEIENIEKILRDIIKN